MGWICWVCICPYVWRTSWKRDCARMRNHPCKKNNIQFGEGNQWVRDVAPFFVGVFRSKSKLLIVCSVPLVPTLAGVNLKFFLFFVGKTNKLWMTVLNARKPPWNNKTTIFQHCFGMFRLCCVAPNWLAKVFLVNHLGYFPIFRVTESNLPNI